MAAPGPTASVKNRQGRLQEIMKISRGTELPQPEPLAKMSVRMCADVPGACH
jgi:hypothetical protein